MEENQFDNAFLEDNLPNLSEMKKALFNEKFSTGEGTAVLPCYEVKYLELLGRGPYKKNSVQNGLLTNFCHHATSQILTPAKIQNSYFP